MEQPLFSDKTHPIRNAWLLKANLKILLAFFFVGAYMYSSSDTPYLSRETTTYIYIGFFSLIVGLRAGLGALFRSRYHYAIGPDGITADQRVFKKHELAVPLSRILKAKMERSFLDDLFGLANVHILYEASTARQAIKAEVIDTAATLMGRPDPIDSRPGLGTRQGNCRLFKQKIICII